MLSSFLPGQEEGNVPFVVDQGFGAFETEPAAIAETIAGWLADPDALARMSAAALAAARPSSTRDIVADLANLALESADERASRRRALMRRGSFYQGPQSRSSEGLRELLSCTRVGPDDEIDGGGLGRRPEVVGCSAVGLMGCERGGDREPPPDDYFVVSHC